MKREKRMCSDCGQEVVTLIDKTGMLIHYEKMCPCIIKILELRKKRFNDYTVYKKTHVKGVY